MAKKFYKTTVSIDVLSEEPLGDPLSLSVLDEMITTGPCVGYNMHSAETELTPKQAADALYEAGSEPGFFSLDDKGNSIDDDDADGPYECANCGATDHPSSECPHDGGHH